MADHDVRQKKTMYRIPSSLDLRQAVGEFTTQVRVGQFDIQFTFGPVDFVVESPIRLLRSGEIIGEWEEGRWPDSGFYDIMNQKVTKCDIASERRIVISFEDGLEMHLEDDSDQYESMQIRISGNPNPIII